MRNSKKLNRNASTFRGFGENMWTGEEDTFCRQRRQEHLEMPPGFTKKRMTKNLNASSKDSTLVSTKGLHQFANGNRSKKNDITIPSLPLQLITQDQCRGFSRKDHSDRNLINTGSNRQKVTDRHPMSTSVRREVSDFVRKETEELKDILHLQYRQRLHKEKQAALLEAEIHRLKKVRGKINTPHKTTS